MTGQASSTYPASYFGWQNRYQWQVPVRPHILGGKTCTGGRYTSGLIFWVGEQVPSTIQASGTCPASYFWLENRYLRPARRPVHVAANIFGGKTGTSDRPGLRYTMKLIFLVGKQVPPTYVQLSCWHSCLRVTIFRSGKASQTGTSNQPDPLLA